MALTTVTGTILHADGTPERGSVSFHPYLPAVDSSVPAVITDAPVVATLDGAGRFTVQLRASDDPGWQTSDPVPYVVTVCGSGWRAVYAAMITDPGPWDLTQLVKLDAMPHVINSAVTGPVGPVGPQGPKGDKGDPGPLSWVNIMGMAPVPYDPTASYVKDDIVLFDGIPWVARHDVQPGHDPATHPANWDVLALDALALKANRALLTSDLKAAVAGATDWAAFQAAVSAM